MKLKLSLMLSFIYVSLWAQPPHTFTANGTVTVPAGITTMNIQAWGGGGAGGGASGAELILVQIKGRGGAGGGGGAYASANITVVASNTLNVLVAGQTTGTVGDGNAGGNSTIQGFQSTIFAAGGSGGASNSTGNSPSGGLGGSVANSVAVGGTIIAGANGGNGTSALLVGLSSGAGGNGANQTLPDGAGGAAITGGLLPNSPGNAGSSAGGGGGGGINSIIGSSQIGGTGASGKVIVSYICPTYSITGISAQNGCITSETSSLVTLTASAASLPTGTYTVTYSRTNPSATGLLATMTVSTAGTGTFTAVGLAQGTNTITVTSLTSGVCVSNITTNNVVNNVTISPASVGGSVAGGTTICSGFTSALLTLSSNVGTVVKWQSLTSPSSTWVDITNTISTYTSGALTATTQFRAVVQSGTCVSANSNSTTVTVNPLPTITLGAVGAVCTNATAQNTTLAYSGTTNTPTTYSIVWSASPTNSFAAVTDATLNASPISIAVPAGTAAGTYTGTITVKNGNTCTSSPGVNFNVVVNPLPTITLGAVGAVCTNTNAQNTTLTYSGTTNTPTTYSIVWSASPTNSFAAVNDATLNASPISIAVPAGTAAGTYSGTLTVKNGNNCSSSSGVGFSVIVNPLPTITLGAVAPICTSASAQNTTLAYSGTTNTPTTYSIVWSASPTNSFAAVTDATLNASPISIAVPAGTAAGTYTGTITVKNANICTSLGVNFNVIVNALPSAPVIGTITPPACLVATGSIALSGLPVGGTLTLFPGSVVEPYSGTTVTISGLAPNTYTFTVNNGTCTSLVSANAVIPGLVTNTYTTSWSNGTPTLDQHIIFAGNYVSAGGGTGDVNGCSCIVNSGVNVTFQPFDTLTIINSISNNGGSITFENHSSLLQIANTTNTGNIIYKRIARQIRQSDFTYWSTPVSPQRLIDVSPLSPYDKFFYYTTSGWKSIVPTNNMVIGKGFIIRAPNNYSNSTKTDYTASFIGLPNNGSLSGETVIAEKFYLIGNPYPSALNVSAFLSANLFLDGTIYLWTHNTPVDLSGAYRYNADDYASYNLTGGVGGQPANSGNSGNNNNVPSGNIAAGQSFFASSIGSGTIVFNNLMRYGGIDNSQFFKSSSTSETTIERHRLWLNMTNEGGAFKQILVGYVEGASNESDNKYDGKSFDANPYLDFYSVVNDNNYVIQGRALPFTDTDIVPLGYRSTITGEFTIAIDHTDGNLSNRAIYLEDKMTSTIHNLRTSNYTFNTSTGTFTNRFVIHYTNKSLGTGEFENEDKNVVVTVKNKAITVSSNVDQISTAYIYDSTGKLLYKKAQISDTTLKIDNLKIADQVLLVKVVLETNATKTYKIIY